MQLKIDHRRKLIDRLHLQIVNKNDKFNKYTQNTHS